ncbi:MAG: serine protease [Gemmataceae bacterium]|nr:serine protease [Gemmataceae bacterium]
MGARQLSIVAGLIASTIYFAAPHRLVAEESVYRRCVRSTVWVIQPASENRFRAGSGTLIDVSKRFILTNYHVVREGDEVLVVFPSFDSRGDVIQDRDHYLKLLKTPNGAIPGKVLIREQSKDLAIVQLARVPKGARAIPLAPAAPSPGDQVHSIGSPGLSAGLFNYTDGRVKAVAWKRYRTGSGPNDPNGFEIDARVIETSSSTNQGDSGGPLLNNRGELVGVTQGILVGGEGVRPISYFIEVGEVRNMLKAHKLSLTPVVVSSSANKSSEDSPSAAAKPPPSKRQREDDAAARLNGAQFFITSNKQKAQELLEDLIERYPDTKAAENARQLLEKLNKGKP